MIKHCHIIAFAALLAQGVWAGDAMARTLSACSVEIPGGLTEDGEGPQPLATLYQDITRQVTAKTGHDFSLIIRPAARCAHLFANGEVDIVWPFIIAEDIDRVKAWGYPEMPVYSMPIIMGGYYIFNKKGEKPFNTVQELEGKTVVSALGYGIPLAYDTSDSINKTTISGNEQIPRMILAGRVDAGILQTGWVGTLRAAGALEGLQHGDIIDFWGGGFTFHANEEGRALSSVFTNIILHMVVNGRYREIMAEAPYYIPEYGGMAETPGQ